MLNIVFTLVATLLLIGCSAVPIQDVDRDELSVTVKYRHQPNRVDLDTEFRTGFWNRRVDAEDNRPEVVTHGGEVRTLNRGAEPGLYSLELDPATGPYRLQLPGFAEMTLPLGEPVRLRGTDAIRAEMFDRDDELTLSVRGETSRPRGWSFTARCGDDRWTLDRSLGSDDTEIHLNLGQLMRQINNAAEADLSGQIPVTVTLWETYDVSWQPPFQPGVARAQDQVDFQVDTESFRVQIRARVQVSENLFFGFQNQAWPTRHCF